MSTATTPTVTVTASGRRRLARTRTALLVGLYALLSLWALALSAAGVGALLGGQLPTASLRFAAVAASCFKVLSVGPAVAVCLTRGRSVLAVRALLFGQVVWFAADLLAPQADDGAPGALLRFLLAVVIWVGPWLALTTDRSRVWRLGLPLRPVMVVVAALGAVPLVLWSLSASTLRLPGSLGVEEMAELRFDLCGLPLAVLAASALAASHRVAWWDALVALVATLLGVAALVGPAGPGSPGPVGAVLLLVPSALVAQRVREQNRDRRA